MSTTTSKKRTVLAKRSWNLFGKNDSISERAPGGTYKAVVKNDSFSDFSVTVFKNGSDDRNIGKGTKTNYQPCNFRDVITVRSDSFAKGSASGYIEFLIIVDEDEE